MKNIPGGEVWAGNPARELKSARLHRGDYYQPVENYYQPVETGHIKTPDGEAQSVPWRDDAVHVRGSALAESVSLRQSEICAIPSVE